MRPLVILVLLTIAATTAAAPEKPPEAVRKAAAALLGPKAKLVKETEHGAVVYEAATTTKLEASFSETGAIQNTELALPLGALPKAVSQAVQTKLTGGAKVSESEVVVTPDGVTFEVETKASNGQEVEYTMDAAGKILKEEHEEETGEDEDRD
jgi:uncharacterized membrane protein YkoI